MTFFEFAPIFISIVATAIALASYRLTRQQVQDKKIEQPLSTWVKYLSEECKHISYLRKPPAEHDVEIVMRNLSFFTRRKLKQQWQHYLDEKNKTTRNSLGETLAINPERAKQAAKACLRTLTNI